MQQFLLTSQSTTQRFIFSFVSIIRKNQASSARRKDKGDGGPSLSTFSTSTKAKGKLKDVIAGVLEEDQGRGLRTVGCTVVQGPVRHPGCTASTLPVFVVRIH